MTREMHNKVSGGLAVVCAVLLGSGIAAPAVGQDYGGWDDGDYDWNYPYDFGNEYGTEDPNSVLYGADQGLQGLSAGSGRNFAVLVGINQYATGSNPLVGCVNDATGLRSAFLADSSRWNSADITLLTDSQATKYNIRSGLYSMGQSTGPGDVCVFSQSSHGGRSQGTSAYLVAYDDYYSDEELGADLANFFNEQTTVIMIVDTCYSGGMFKGSANARAAAEGVNAAFVQNVMAAYQSAKLGSAKSDAALAKNLGGNIAFITAADYNQESSDVINPQFAGFSAPQGLFTGFLLKAFQAAETDTSRDGQLSFWELYAWAAPHANQGQTAQTFNQPLLQQTIAGRAGAGGGISGSQATTPFIPDPGPCGVLGGFPMLMTLGVVGLVGIGRRSGSRRS